MKKGEYAINPIFEDNDFKKLKPQCPDGAIATLLLYIILRPGLVYIVLNQCTGMSTEIQSF